MANEFNIGKRLVVKGSGSLILDIQGSQGQLFSVNDSLSGSLFAVKDISGFPIFEVFSNNVIVASASLFSSSVVIPPSGIFVLPLTSSNTPQTGSAYWSGSYLFVYDGVKYKSSSFS
jgi:hypothetical protein